MKKLLCILSILSFLNLTFWLALRYIGGLSYLYYSKNVVNAIYTFFAIAILVLVIVIAIIIMMYKCRKSIRIISIVLLIAFITAAHSVSFISFAYSVISPSIGCSYTEDIANYGKYDVKYNPTYFPQSVSEDMTVVEFVYFHKYVDINQTDIFLEVKFENGEVFSLSGNYKDVYNTQAVRYRRFGVLPE